MPIKTQGTKLYIIDPEGATSGAAVLPIDCAVSISGLNAPREQIDVTCLEDAARQFVPGLGSPGQMSVTLSFDFANPSHVRIHELWKAGTKVEMAIGFGDGDLNTAGELDAPDLGTDDLFDLPDTRNWVVLHQAYFADVPFDIALNTVVQSTVSVQLSGFPDIIPKAA